MNVLQLSLLRLATGPRVRGTSGWPWGKGEMYCELNGQPDMTYSTVFDGYFGMFKLFCIDMKLSATIYSKNTPRKLYRVVEEHFCQPCPNLAGMFLHSSVHRWASRHSLGFEDENLGSSPSWWAATVATYCPSRLGELPKLLSSKSSEWWAA